MISAAV
ncbi:hypothetical protein D047_4321A, partial [Vibrio parahaemolyticus VPTS-2010_2]